MDRSFLRPPQEILVAARWRAEKTEQGSCNWIARRRNLGRLRPNPLTLNHMASRDRICISPARLRDLKNAPAVRAMCKENGTWYLPRPGNFVTRHWMTDIAVGGTPKPVRSKPDAARPGLLPLFMALGFVVGCRLLLYAWMPDRATDFDFL